MLIKLLENIRPGWKSFLIEETQKQYFIELNNFLTGEYNSKKTIFPQQQSIFECLNRIDIDEVKIVILGQDPYHGEGQAHGLAFSVPEGQKLPPSLKNIFKELESDLGKNPPSSGDLSHWLNQGVLLLNTVLTVEKSKAGSHQKKGWEIFTNRIIEIINTNCKEIVYILWGSPAQKKMSLLDKNSNLIIHSPHPSPLSSYRGFFGSRPFSKTNNYLAKNGKKTIHWT